MGRESTNGMWSDQRRGVNRAILVINRHLTDAYATQGTCAMVSTVITHPLKTLNKALSEDGHECNVRGMSQVNTRSFQRAERGTGRIRLPTSARQLLSTPLCAIRFTICQQPDQKMTFPKTYILHIILNALNLSKTA